MLFPLNHPPRVALDVEVERELELLLARVGGDAGSSPVDWSTRRDCGRCCDGPPTVDLRRPPSAPPPGS